MKLGEDVFELNGKGGRVFYHPENDAILICVVPTDNELDGYEEFDELILDVSENETESWSIIMTFSTKEFFDMNEELRRMKR